MFDINKRGGQSPRQSDEHVDNELEQDRFTPPRTAPPSAGGARVREAAIIGPSIHIDGDLRGEEDLIIEGTVTGTIQMRENSLTIGANGKVKANVYANSVFVEGSLEGDLFGSDRVAIRKSGSVRGNIVSPRVSLEDGGTFKGTVEMDQQAVDAAFGRSGSRSGQSSAASGSSASGSASASAASSAKSASGDESRSASKDSGDKSASSAGSATGAAAAGKS